MASGRAVEESWDVGEPYEAEKARQKRRWEKREREGEGRQEQEDQQVLENDQEEDGSPEGDKEGNENETEQEHEEPKAAGDEEDYREYSEERADGDDQADGQDFELQEPQGTTTNSAPSMPDKPTGDANPITSPSTAQSGSITIPFLPLPPTFAQPQGHYPPLLSALVRARVDKWTAMNDQILPMAAAMREGAWVWGGRVARELARRRREVNELSMRVDVVDGLRQMQSKNNRGGGKEEVAGVPDGCTII
ncbi:hypothetical protein H1R20_g11313, partial [Candolleomyces eurysporus]